MKGRRKVHEEGRRDRMGRGRGVGGITRVQQSRWKEGLSGEQLSGGGGGQRK